MCCLSTLHIPYLYTSWLKLNYPSSAEAMTVSAIVELVGGINKVLAFREKVPILEVFVFSKTWIFSLDLILQSFKRGSNLIKILDLSNCGCFKIFIFEGTETFGEVSIWFGWLGVSFKTEILDSNNPIAKN